MVKRVADFLAWMLLPERIPPPASGEAGAVPGRGVPFWRWLFAPEPLPDDPVPAAASRVPGPSFVRRLLSREPLAFDPPDRAPRRPSRIRSLLEPDALPFEAPATRGERRSFLGGLFSREPIDGPCTCKE